MGLIKIFKKVRHIVYMALMVVTVISGFAFFGQWLSV